MSFVKAMKEAMKLIYAACKQNDEWANCYRCPFRDYCDVIEQAGMGTPDEWWDE